MGRPEDHEVSFTNNNGWRISKKFSFFLATIAAISCLAVGLIVYYVGVANFSCGHIDEVVDGLQLKNSDTHHKTSSQDASKDSKAKDIRLPGHLIPEKYKIELVPFIIPGNFTIRGKVIITMNCTQSGKNVTLHVADMELKEESIILKETGTDNIIHISEHAYDKNREFYIAKLSNGLTPGKSYTITIEYTAQLSDSLKGFYRSTYKDKTTEQDEYIAITQFQPTDARRAFPCMDEPALKARFEVSLGRTNEMSSISNMPMRSDGLGIPMEGTDEYVWDHFDESVPMSTYLVAFVVSKFEYQVSPKLDNDVTFRIWARKDAIDQVEYAKDVGPKILSFFEKYFDVPYPLPKQDMIAVQDFSAGAMENWGLITYRESAMLFKPGVSALSNKERVATIISHELAHQWFGNLVTPSWWTDLWLNEGFASFVEYLGVEAVQPELKVMEQFVISDLQSVMSIDALESSHPISIEVKHPDEINEIFDRISYAKGASIIRMMSHFLTTETFQKGLSKYLRFFQFKAAHQDDLWHHLTLQAHEDGVLPKTVTVKTIMDTWTLQTGFPVVTVVRDYAKNSATVTQKRFLVTGKEDDTKWWVPITYITPGGNFNDTHNKIWMTKNDKIKTIEEMPEQNVPVIFNVQETGYYRVNYDEKNWEMLIETLKTNHESIHVTNRAQIIDDALNLARVGQLKYEVALGITSYLHKETEYVPWSAALDNFGYMSKMLRRSGAYGEFKKYMRKLVKPLMERVGFELKDSDQPLDVQLRRLAITWACGLGIKECEDTVKAQFQSWMDHPTPDIEEANYIDVDMRSTVYCTAIENGGEDEWEFGWKRYTSSNVASEKSNILNSLTCTKEIWLLNRFLNWSLTDGTGVRKSDGRNVISRIGTNNVGVELTFDFIRNNWKSVLDYYGSTSFALSGLMKNVLKDRNTQFALDELKRFQSENQESLSTAKREVEQAIESAEANLKWMNNNYNTIHLWLQKANNGTV